MLIRFRVVGLVLLVCLLAPAAASAQIVTWTFRVYRAGDPMPIVTLPLPPQTIVCDQASAPVPAPTDPPSMVVWDDRDRPGRLCVWTDAPIGPLRSLATGLYEGGLTATADGVPHPESARAPFVVQVGAAIVVIATNVRVL